MTEKSGMTKKKKRLGGKAPVRPSRRGPAIAGPLLRMRIVIEGIEDDPRPV